MYLKMHHCTTEGDLCLHIWLYIGLITFLTIFSNISLNAFVIIGKTTHM